MKTIILLSTFYFLLFSVFIAQAALVPCGPGSGAGACTFCQLFTLAERVINFAIFNIAVPLAVIAIIYGGFVIMTAGDSTEKAKKGKSILTAAVVGVVIALASWLIIDTILNVIAVGKIPDQWWNPRSAINC